MGITTKAIATSFLFLLLTACGGGGGNDPSQTDAGADAQNGQSAGDSSSQPPSQPATPSDQTPSPETAQEQEGVYLVAGMPNENGFVDGAGMQARFNAISQLEIDGDDNFYVFDSGTIRKVTPNGTVITLAGQQGVQGHQDGIGIQASFGPTPRIAVTNSGTIYVADAPYIRKISPAGEVTTIAGGPGRAVADGPVATAGFASTMNSIAVDSVGNIYVNNGMLYTDAIRKLSQDGTVTTIYQCNSACTNLRTDSQDNLYLYKYLVPYSRIDSYRIPIQSTVVISPSGQTTAFNSLLGNLPIHTVDTQLTEFYPGLRCCYVSYTSSIAGIANDGNIYFYYSIDTYQDGRADGGYLTKNLVKTDRYLLKRAPSGEVTAIEPFTLLSGQTPPSHTDPSGITLPPLGPTRLAVSKRGTIYYAHQSFIGKVIVSD